MNRAGAAATTRTCRGDGSRRRGGCDVERTAPAFPAKRFARTVLVSPNEVEAHRSDGGSLNDDSAQFTMTHAVATPSVPRRVMYTSPTRRMRSRRYEQVGSASGSVSRPDFYDCLRRSAAVLHKHVTVCDWRRRRATPDTQETGQFRESAAKLFEEAQYRRPRGSSIDGSRRRRGRDVGSHGGDERRRGRDVDSHGGDEQRRGRDVWKFWSRPARASRYVSPQYEVTMYQFQLIWSGFQFSQRKLEPEYVRRADMSL